ncbi:MAG: hypothetical protein QOD77_936 [Thermoplasmata archaeon]|jgi:hypothetical protein|nr:hypothetical protein [Thermoplasmata archaeon]
MRTQSLHLPAPERAGLAIAGLAIGCLWYLDVLTTAWALEQGAIELGPLAGVLVAHGYEALLAAKLAGLLLILAVAGRQVAMGRGGAAHWGLLVVGCVSMAVVVWNLLSVLALVGAV